MNSFLGFAARIDSIDHPVAVFKLSRSGAFCWSWLDPCNGHVVILDPLQAIGGVRLCAGHVFRSVTEHHFSYHSTGRRHRTIQSRATQHAQHLGKEDSTALANLRSWRSLRSVPVPLEGSFPTKMDAGVWRAVQRPEILRSEDFKGASGVDLHAYLCRRDQVRNLLQRWRSATRHWMAGTRQDVRMVVLAEPR